MRRFIRLTNGFSKEVENHTYTVGLQLMYCKFMNLHFKPNVGPAVAAGVSSKLC